MVKVKVEAKFKITGRGYFIAFRPLDIHQDWFMKEKMLLGDFEIKPILEVPLRRLENGKPDTNIYAVCLKYDKDFDSIQVDEILALQHQEPNEPI